MKILIQILIYVPIAIAVILPLLFRRSVLARVVSVVMLLLVAALHLGFLVAVHRVVAETGPRYIDPVKNYDTAVNQIQNYSQHEILPFCALIAAFSFLALLPKR